MRIRLGAPALLAALLMVSGAWAQENKPEKEQITQEQQLRMVLQDQAKKVTFEIKPDGKVSLQIVQHPGTEKAKTETYEAPSFKAFKEQHPDLVRTYGLKEMVGKMPSAKTWPDLQKEFAQNWFWNPDQAKDLFQGFRGIEGLQDWLHRQNDMFREFRELAPHPQQGPHLGILVRRVEPALAAQLGLKEGQGLVVAKVEPKSIAARAGLQKHDLILELDGKPVGDLAAFRDQVQSCLAKGMDLALLRAGKRTQVKIEPISSSK